MTIDHSRGWDAAASSFIALRSNVGALTVGRWARQLTPCGAVLDLGCGSGTPIASTLIEGGFRVFGVDASPTLVGIFRSNFPMAEAICEPVETSPLFHRTFDGAVAIGLLFLLAAEEQVQVIKRVSRALRPGARFLFTAPKQACGWTDTLTNQSSLSLGEAGYRHALKHSGMELVGQYTDDGANHYYDAVRTEIRP